jgi:hypothetical protein
MESAINSSLLIAKLMFITKATKSPKLIASFIAARIVTKFTKSELRLVKL